MHNGLHCPSLCKPFPFGTATQVHTWNQRNRPELAALAWMQDASWASADILLVSDGELATPPVPPDLMAKLHVRTRRTHSTGSPPRRRLETKPTKLDTEEFPIRA